MILHVSTWLLSKLAQKETWGVFYENSLCTFATTSVLVQVLWMCVSFLLQWFTCPVYLDLVSAAPIEIWKEKIWKDGEYRWFSQNNLMPHLGYFCFADRVHFSWVVPHCSTNWTQQHFLLILKSRLPARVLMFAGYFFNNFHVHSSQKQATAIVNGQMPYWPHILMHELLPAHQNSSSFIIWAAVHISKLECAWKRQKICRLYSASFINLFTHVKNFIACVVTAQWHLHKQIPLIFINGNFVISLLGSM